MKENETADRQKRILRWLFEFQKLKGLRLLEVENIKIREAQRKLKELAVVQCCVAKTVLFTEGVEQPTAAEVLELHAWVRSVFQHARPSSGGLRRMTYPKLPYEVDYHQAPDQFKWLPTIDDRKHKNPVYLASMVSLLEEYDSKIARCANENCEELFLKSGRQKYHSEVCAQQTAFKSWYGRDPEGARAKARVRYHRRKYHVE